MKKDKKEVSEAIQTLEIAVERLYEFINYRGEIDWKAKIKHPEDANLKPEDDSPQSRVMWAAVDIDKLIMRMISKDNKIAKKQRRKAKRK